MGVIIVYFYFSLAFFNLVYIFIRSVTPGQRTVSDGVQYHGHLQSVADHLGTQIPIKQEPTDREFDGNFLDYLKNNQRFSYTSCIQTHFDKTPI